MLRSTIGLLFILTICSCGKDDEPPKPLATDEMIVGSWKITAMQQNPLVLDYDRDGSADLNIFPFVEACSRDDLFIYVADKTYREEEGPIKCNYNPNQVKLTANWQLKENGTLLMSGTRVSKILEITTNAMRVQESSFLGGINYIAIVTYTKL